MSFSPFYLDFRALFHRPPTVACIWYSNVQVPGHFPLVNIVQPALIIFIVWHHLYSQHHRNNVRLWFQWFRRRHLLRKAIVICYHLDSSFPRLLSLLPPPCSSVFDTMGLLPPRLLFSSTPLSIITTMLVRIWYDGSVTTSCLVFLDSALYDRDIIHQSVRKFLHCLSTLNLFIYSRADLLRAEIRWKYIIY